MEGSPSERRLSNAAKMDVDNPLMLLKRSSSAPMINSNDTNTTNNNLVRDSMSVLPCIGGTGAAAPRPRRFSTSYSPLGGGPSSPKLTPRVNQLRREESVDVLSGREAAHERELNSAMVMSQSWEDLTLMAENIKGGDNGEGGGGSKVRGGGGMLDALQLNLPTQVSSPVQCSSPSPTRAGLSLKQCFSPSMFKTTLSPSPTRKFATRRSQSPIAMRPSPLGPVKRKFELDEPEPSAKRGGLLLAQAKLDCEGRNSLEGETGCEPLPALQDHPMPDVSKAN